MADSNPTQDVSSDSPSSLSAASQPDAAGPPPKKYKQLSFPTHEELMQTEVFDNCAFRSAMAAAGGVAFGVLFGVFTASMETGGSLDPIHHDVEKPTRQILKETFINMKQRSMSYAKSFAYLGLVYSGAECIVEKYRAKHDKANAAYAGCIAGGIMAYGGGPKAMCFGCAGFAAFSTAIEVFLDS